MYYVSSYKIDYLSNSNTHILKTVFDSSGSSGSGSNVTADSILQIPSDASKEERQKLMERAILNGMTRTQDNVKTAAWKWTKQVSDKRASTSSAGPE